MEATHSHGRTVFAWMLLAFAVTAFIAIQHWAAAQVAHDNGEAMKQFSLRLNSRLQIGMRQFLPMPPAPEMEVAAMLGQAMKHPDLALCTVAVIAETAGPSRAQRAIDTFEHSFEDDDVSAELQTLRLIYTQGSAAVSPQHAEALRQRIGWYADLALTHDLDPSDPLRQAAIAPAGRTAVAFFAVGFVFLLSSLAGLVLCVVGIVLLCTGRLHLHHRESLTQGTYVPATFVETLAIFLVAVLLISTIGGVFEELTGIAIMGVLLWIVAGVLLWPCIWGMRRSELSRAIGWRRGRGIMREIGAGLIGYMAGIPILIAAGIIVVLLALLSQQTPSHPAEVELLDAGRWKVISVVMLACIWAPVLEELAFRGVFYSYLRQRMAAPLAGLMAGVVFAIIHPQGWIAMPILAALGFNFAMIREWRGSIIAPITAHCVHNSTVFLFLLFAIL